MHLMPVPFNKYSPSYSSRAGCIHLSRLANLTSLNLAQNERITNRGASYLASLSKLKALNLSYTRVNLEGLRNFLNYCNFNRLLYTGRVGFKML